MHISAKIVIFGQNKQGCSLARKGYGNEVNDAIVSKIDHTF